MSVAKWKPELPRYRNYKKKVFLTLSKVSDFVYQIGELEGLRKSSDPVELAEITSVDFKKKVQYLKNCLLQYRKLTGYGRGITAIQVGIPLRFSVIYLPDEKDKLLVIINPKIVKKSKEQLRYPEICMSANPIIAPVVRPEWVEVEYVDEDGVKQLWTNKNKMYNRVLQHEIDHMNGIINIDLVKSKSLILESDPKFYDKATFEKV